MLVYKDKEQVDCNGEKVYSAIPGVFRNVQKYGNYFTILKQRQPAYRSCFRNEY